MMRLREWIPSTFHFQSLSLGKATSTTIFSSKTDKAVGFEGALICPASQKRGCEISP